MTEIKATIASPDTNFPEEDKVIEEIALWDELKEEKEDEETSIKVAGKAIVKEGAEFVVEPRAKIKMGELKAERGSKTTFKTGSVVTIAREDDEIDDEVTEEDDEQVETIAAEKIRPKKEFAIEEGATLETEVESKMEFERDVRFDGNAKISGEMKFLKDDHGKVVEEEDATEAETTTTTTPTKTEAKGEVEFEVGSIVKGVGRVSAKIIKFTGNSVLRPGHSPGTFEMDCDVILDSGSQVQFEIITIEPDQYDLLQINGKMKLGGTMNVDSGSTCLEPVSVITTQEGLENDFDEFERGATVGASGSKSEDGYDYKIGCSICGANQYVKKVTTTMGACTECPNGKTNTKGDVPWGSATECDTPIVKCEIGEHVKGSTCVPCPAGSTGDKEDVITAVDTECPANAICKVNQHVKNYLCTDCAKYFEREGGDKTSTVGGETTCLVKVCKVNQHVAKDTDGITNICKACDTAAGKFREAGDFLNEDVTTCKSNDDYCSANQKRVSSDCVDCSAGKNSPRVAKTGATDTTCAATLCEKDQYVSSNTCTACAAGKSIEAGGDASDEDTICVVQLCPNNYHVEDHKCVACEAGATVAAGGDATGADTVCVAVTCEKDHLVKSNSCEKCPGGKFRDAGDLTTGVDTQCTATMCKITEYVENNKCKACQVEWKTAAITDASKDNNQANNKCIAPPTVSLSGEFEIQGITVDAAEKAEPTLKKIIHKTFKKTSSQLLLRHVTIDSIAAGARRRLLLSRDLAADVVVKYTVTNLVDAAEVAAAKLAFEKEVVEGSFVTALRNEDQATFGDAKVYKKDEATQNEAAVPTTTPTPMTDGRKVKEVPVSLGMILGIVCGTVLVLIIAGYVLKRKKTQQNGDGDKTKVTPVVPMPEVIATIPTNQQNAQRSWE